MTKPRKVTQTELARIHGVSRITIYRWLKEPDCPDPAVDPAGFEAWVQARSFEPRGRPKPSSSKSVAPSGMDVAEMKASKIRADTVRQWQRVTEYIDAVRSEQSLADWTETQDILAEYQSELQRAAIDEKARTELNRLMAKAVAKVEHRTVRAETRRDAANAALEDRLMQVGPPRG